MNIKSQKYKSPEDALILNLQSLSKKPVMENLKQEMREIDQCLGNRIFLQRRKLGLTRREFGRMIGVSSQQLAKYETAKNRVSASRLVIISRHLNKPIRYFYDK